MREPKAQFMGAGRGRFQPQGPPIALGPLPVRQQKAQLVRWKHLPPPHACRGKRAIESKQIEQMQREGSIIYDNRCRLLKEI